MIKYSLLYLDLIHIPVHFFITALSLSLLYIQKTGHRAEVKIRYVSLIETLVKKKHRMNLQIIQLTMVMISPPMQIKAL